jgi:hypothetical protein
VRIAAVREAVRGPKRRSLRRNRMSGVGGYSDRRSIGRRRVWREVADVEHRYFATPRGRSLRTAMPSY